MKKTRNKKIKKNLQASLYYEMPGKGAEDVSMDLVELDRVAYGQPYKASVQLEVGGWP